MAFHSLGWPYGRDRVVRLCAFGQRNRIYGASHCSSYTVRYCWVRCMARTTQIVIVPSGLAAGFAEQFCLSLPPVKKFIAYAVLPRSIDASTTWRASSAFPHPLKLTRLPFQPFFQSL